ncbi:MULTISPECIES: hypothetical protein [unclassified Caballeronia]|uniref:hypothetical protein n=1 Tax=unclassified Caballeronia TaxID=2646786 RepID=UPI00285AD569|nr:MULTISPECIES: hypothetical protein [unclassified Caballeronia]MDR5741291.1 hypothetical protein [Caballeronia sp. LZ016]MDR5807188.1 hypothetical protein [Caballeronia sp. LZ019]
MNTIRRGFSAFPDYALHLWWSACMIRLRYGSALLALPLCSSLCFFGLRFVLESAGVSV